MHIQPSDNRIIACDDILMSGVKNEQRLMEQQQLQLMREKNR